MPTANAPSPKKLREGLNNPNSKWILRILDIEEEDSYQKALAVFETVSTCSGKAAEQFSNLLATILDSYEREHFEVPDAAPNEVLAYLMDARGLKQNDLQGVVHQGHLSAMLKGKRNIGIKTAAQLGEYFDVNPSVFIDFRIESTKA